MRPRVLAAAGVTAGAGCVFAFAGSMVSSYGYGMFLFLPFTIGLVTVLLAFRHAPSSLECIKVSTIAILLTGSLLLLLGVEGLLCLCMALPIALPSAWMGALAGYYLRGRRTQAIFGAAALLISPGSMGVEALLNPRPEQYAVRSTIDINARPEVVWRHMIDFPELPPPTELAFRAGIAYPIHATMTGRGVGAVRRCTFSTGDFVEPIQVWDEPHLLRFSVTSNPAPLNEFSPWGAVHPRHLDGFLVARQGQFLLRELPGGRTRLEGTTWYRHGLWPAGYWRGWSDALIHRIHMRVLLHIQRLAEAAG